MEDVGDRKGKIFRKSGTRVRTKKNSQNSWRERDAPDEMDQKSNLKFNQIKVDGCRMFHSNALFNRHDFISCLVSWRDEHSWTTSTRFFPKELECFSRKRGKENGGGVEARLREAWLLSGNYYQWQPSFEWKVEKKKEKRRKVKKRSVIVWASWRLRVRSWFYFRERWIQRMVLS